MRSRALLISIALHAAPVAALAWSGHLGLLGTASEGGSGWARLYPVVCVGDMASPPGPAPEPEDIVETVPKPPEVPEESGISVPAPAPAAAPAGGGSGGPLQGEGDSLGSAGELGGPVWNPRPAYPARARTAGWEGQVTIALTVGAAGRVLEAQVVSSSGFELLDRAALEALRCWRFAPREVGASPIRITQDVLFQLKEGSS